MASMESVANYGAAELGTGEPGLPACRPRVGDIVRGCEAEPGVYGVVVGPTDDLYLRLALYRDGAFVGNVLDLPDGLWLRYRPNVGGDAAAHEAVTGHRPEQLQPQPWTADDWAIGLGEIDAGGE
jgi:hypothetical protein